MNVVDTLLSWGEKIIMGDTAISYVESCFDIFQNYQQTNLIQHIFLSAVFAYYVVATWTSLSDTIEQIHSPEVFRELMFLIHDINNNNELWWNIEIPLETIFPAISIVHMILLSLQLCVIISLSFCINQPEFIVSLIFGYIIIHIYYIILNAYRQSRREAKTIIFILFYIVFYRTIATIVIIIFYYTLCMLDVVIQMLPEQEKFEFPMD
jgi:hypothetical protein